MTSTYFCDFLTTSPSLSAKSIVFVCNVLHFMNPFPLVCRHHIWKPPLLSAHCPRNIAPIVFTMTDEIVSRMLDLPTDGGVVVVHVVVSGYRVGSGRRSVLARVSMYTRDYIER